MSETQQLTSNTDENLPPQQIKSNKVKIMGSIGVLFVVALVISASITVYFTFPRSLVRSISASNIFEHLEVLSTLGPRRGEALTTSIETIENILKEKASSLKLSKHCFKYPRYDSLEKETIFEVIIEGQVGKILSLTPKADFLLFKFCEKKELTNQLVFVGTGCYDSEYPQTTNLTDSVFLVQDWGNCTFEQKLSKSVSKGASALIFQGEIGKGSAFYYNNPALSIPAVGVSFTTGNFLMSLISVNNVLIHLHVFTSVETIQSCNLIAETNIGRNDSILAIGAHLDTVENTTGINDNGSGSSAVLELAIRTQSTLLCENTKNKLMFFWWSGEEDGLWGSYSYLTEIGENKRNDFAGYINLDMIASPNYIHFLGNNSTAPLNVQLGVSILETELKTYYDENKISYQVHDFEGGSDFWGFLQFGIPAQDVFSGASETKSEQQRDSFGGLANAICDPCYHQHCDSLLNYDSNCLEQETRAVAYAFEKLAKTSNLKGLLRPTINNFDASNANNVFNEQSLAKSWILNQQKIEQNLMKNKNYIEKNLKKSH